MPLNTVSFVLNRLGWSDLGAEEIKYHEFFSTVSWSMMTNKEIEPPIKPKKEDEELRIKSLKLDEISHDELYIEDDNEDNDQEERKSSPTAWKKLTKNIKNDNVSKEYRYFEGFDFIRSEKANTK